MTILDEESAQKKQLRFLNRASKSVSTGDALALFALGTFGLHLITFFVLLLLYGSYSQLNKKAPPSLVQLETGKSIKVAPLGSLERTPQVILRFVSDTMTLMMNWSGTLPSTTVEEAAQPKPDPGVNISNRGLRGNKVRQRSLLPRGDAKSDGGLPQERLPNHEVVASAAWQASYALSEDFRKEFLKVLAAITPSGVFQGKTQVVLVPLSIQSPIKISEGKWKIKMVANLNIFDQASNLGEVIPFNKEIFVRAVTAPESPNTVDGLAAVIYQVRSSGLEIYAIRDLAQENL